MGHNLTLTSVVRNEVSLFELQYDPYVTLAFHRRCFRDRRDLISVTRVMQNIPREANSPPSISPCVLHCLIAQDI